MTTLEDVEAALYATLKAIDWSVSPDPQILWDNTVTTAPRLPRITVTKGGETGRLLSINGTDYEASSFVDFAILVPKGTGKTVVWALVSDLREAFPPGHQIVQGSAFVSGPLQVSGGYTDGDAYRVPVLVPYRYLGDVA